ncbi:quinon protein alcohol dehydrogenase-like superfamily [Syncephalis pseudoplumigaleata]|uniref:Quinon protein alcohol dehydrogenase-like superfamily n=1 Tax=Syncephalis pseudoplumigaleata TaxID=1712513 RepID=A0A4P9Z481_9FUNG|nr:quinon protein alcohol dehydrogenase-like superfamily [Syncephalis pseudoplumigaleata]|eukprot:RKP27367.1 quinon protein alcohol dehydrogenase-like superfamily [Syncephalis pseudoplumigaleata]
MPAFSKLNSLPLRGPASLTEVAHISTAQSVRLAGWLAGWDDALLSDYSCGGGGGQLVVVPSTIRRAPHLLAEIVAATEVTLLMMTPSLFMSLEPSFVEQVLRGVATSVADIVLGGEAFPTGWLAARSDHADTKQKRKRMRMGRSGPGDVHAPVSKPRLWNIYGTTECSVWATLHRVDLAAEAIEGTPIGVPLTGIALSISAVEESRQRDGETWGELVIRVDGRRCCRVGHGREPMHVLSLQPDVDNSRASALTMARLVAFLQLKRHATGASADAASQDIDAAYYVAMGGTSVEAVRIIHTLWGTFIDKLYECVSEVCAMHDSHDHARHHIDVPATSAIRVDEHELNSADLPALYLVAGSVIKRASAVSIAASTATSLSSSNGRVRWRIDLGKCVDASPIAARYHHASSPAGDRRVAWIGSHAGLMAAVDIDQGTLLWQTQLPDRIESSAGVSGDGKHVIVGNCASICLAHTPAAYSHPLWNVGCYDGRLYVMEALTGRLINRFTTGAMIKSSPCVDPLSGRVWFGSYDGHLYCVRIRREASTCALEGRLNCQAPLFASCAIDPVHRIAIAATLHGDVWAVDVTPPPCTERDSTAPLAVIWRSRPGHLANDNDAVDHDTPYFSTPAIDADRGRVLIGNANGHLYCFSISQGECLWRCNSGGPIFSSPCLWRDRVVVGTHAGGLLCCSVDAGHRLWQTSLPPSADGAASANVVPVYASPFLLVDDAAKCGRVVAASIDGRLWIGDMEQGAFAPWIQLPGEVFSSPIVIGTDSAGTTSSAPCILVGCRDNGFYAIQAS